MIADLRLKTIILIAVSTVIIMLVLATAYSSARARAYAKLDPYAITFSLQAEQESNLIMAYDYGYGITKDHQRVIALKGLDTEQEFRVSLSAWKTLRSITFISPAESAYQIKFFSISKAQDSLSLTGPELSSSIEDGNIIYRLNLKAWGH